jgi:hypothetical protein
LGGVAQHVGTAGEDRPPVAARAGGGAGLSHGIAIAEQQVVELQVRSSVTSARGISRRRGIRRSTVADGRLMLHVIR